MNKLLASRLRNVEQSVTVSLDARAKELISSGKKIINLTAGELSFPAPKYARMAINLGMRENTYAPVAGKQEVRIKIASMLSKLYGGQFSADNIAVTAGAKPGLFASIMSVAKGNEEVIIPTPCWVSYEQQVLLSGNKPIFVPLTKKFDLDIEGIKKKITNKTRAVIINSPHNPTGAVFSKKSLSALAKIVTDKSIFLISDDVYHPYTYECTNIFPASLFKDRSPVIIVNSFSKSHAIAGWRAGFVAAHPEVIKRIVSIQGQINGNVSTLSQAAAFCCAQNPSPKLFATALRKSRQAVIDGLSKIPGITFNPPAGALFVFFKLPDGIVANEFCTFLLDKFGVALVPGEAFKSPGHVRMSFASPIKAVTDACKKINTALHVYK